MICLGTDYAMGLKTRFVANQFWCIFFIIFAIFFIILVLLAKRLKSPLLTFIMIIPVSSLDLFYKAFSFDLYNSYDVTRLQALKAANDPLYDI
jgi:hypothetical protein